MRKVAIVGVGQTSRSPEYRRRSDNMSWQDYVIEAVYEAIEDAGKGLSPKDIEYVVINYHGESQIEAGGIGPVVSDMLGLHPTGVTPLCANCTGGGVGMHDAYGLVASGMYDRVLAVGFDKTFDLHNTSDKRAIGGDVEFDFQFGYDHPTLQALLQVYAYKKWGKKKVLKALVAYRDHALWFAARNPKACYYGLNFPFSLKEMFELIDQMDDDSVYIPEEFWAKVPPAFLVDGAAAMIMVPAEDAKAYTDHPIYLDAISYKCNSHLLSKQMFYPVPELAEFSMVDFGATHLAVADAYKMAGISAKDVDFIQAYEPHVTSLVPMVAATQVIPDRDKVVDFIIDGGTSHEGRLPTGTDGGRGLFGMTSGSNVGDGVYETVKQMRGEAGERQLKKTNIALVMGMQGEMASSSCAVLRNSR
jgi:acetyl-CoA C-acetyltransferase